MAVGLGQTAVWQRARDAKGNEWTQKRGAHRFPDPPPPGAPRTHDSQHCIHQPTAGPPRHTASNGGKALIVHRAHHGLENAELSLHKSESQVRSPRHTGRGPSSFLPHSVYSCPRLPTAPPPPPAPLQLGSCLGKLQRQGSTTSYEKHPIQASRDLQNQSLGVRRLPWPLSC